MGGTLGKMMKMMPGMSKVEDKQLVAAEKQLKKSKLVIQAFTEEERANPESLMGKDSEPIRKRVAEESGQSLSEVNDILSQFPRRGIRCRSSWRCRMRRASWGCPGS